MFEDRKHKGILIALSVVVVLVAVGIFSAIFSGESYETPNSDNDYTGGLENIGNYKPPKGSRVLGKPENTELEEKGRIRIEGIGDFKFEPADVATRRPDIFQPGHFSVFDIVAYLDEKGQIEAEYHFQEDMNTYVLDSINGEKNWWYRAYYDGGWNERNAFRMDQYPVKDGMHIRLIQSSPSVIEKIHESYRDQEAREQTGGEAIVQNVSIRGRNSTLTFENVVVNPHNLRSDVFKPGIITAIDVILTLGDQGKLSYDLQWLESIGNAQIKNYYVTRINEDESFGRCGFVYESGEKNLISRNHIHIPSDMRVINSPEYMEWFWICI